MKTRHTPSRLKVSQLAHYMVENKIYLDEAFQSNTRWGTLPNQEYMKSIIEGRAITPITVGNVDSILAQLEIRFGPTHIDYNFFKNLQDNKFKLITIDGNNRDNCIFKFINNEFPLTLGRYESDEGELAEFTITQDNKYYKDLDPSVKNYINNIDLNLCVVTQSTRIGLADLFSNVNKGMVLNSQEKRNAIPCKFGQLVRDTAKKHADGFGRIFSKINKNKETPDEKKINRRFPDELIVKTAVIVTHGTVKGLFSPPLDAAYSDNTSEVVTFKHTEKIISQLTNLAIKYGKSAFAAAGAYDSNVIDLVMLLNHLNKNKVVIEDDKAFYNWFAESQIARTANTETIYEGKTGTNKRTYAGLLRSANPTFLKLREDMLIDSISEVPDGILTFRDTNRNYNPKIRYTLWKRQDGKCSITGKEIEPRHILDGQVTHIDHNVPHRHGGETTLENARLVYKEANLEKSDVFEIVTEELVLD